MAQATQPQRYQILVEGALDPKWSECLGGLAVSVREGPEQPLVTELTGALEDQAALQGVLDTLFMLNLRLLHVERRPPDIGEADRHHVGSIDSMAVQSTRGGS
jgi:hypothetical protein